jgi:pimeloyl-ACP methyl ester carboxylesterase
VLVSERIGQLFVESEAGRDRLEYTEHGAGDAWVVLLPAELMPRRMLQPLAVALAAEGLHVVTLDPLGHGRSDRPADPHAYSVTGLAEQVVALLDHLGAEQAVVGGCSLGANVALETAAIAPDRVRGLILEAPVLDHGAAAALLALTPLAVAARYAPASVGLLRGLTRSVPRGVVPFWAGIALDACDQRAGAVAALAHGLVVGRLAPPARQRRRIAVPTLVVGHPLDPVRRMADAVLVAGEIPGATLVRARHPLEWRLRPERLDGAALDLVARCWDARRAREPGLQERGRGERSRRERSRRRGRRAGA